MTITRLHTITFAAAAAVGTTALAVAFAMGALTPEPRDNADHAWVLERVMPPPTAGDDEGPTVLLRYDRRPCREVPAPLPSSIAAESGLFLLGNPPPTVVTDDAPDAVEQRI